MDTLYGAWHFVLSSIFGPGAFIAVLVKANGDQKFLRRSYWAWLVGATGWLMLAYLVHASEDFDFLWAKVVVAVGVLSNIVFGGIVATVLRGK